MVMARCMGCPGKVEKGLRMIRTVDRLARGWLAAGSLCLILSSATPIRADDFTDQGEYASHVAGYARASGSPIGLQVVARGEGRFRAALMPGGLPGNGWTRGDRIELTGQREGDRVLLHGGNYTVSLHNGRAELTRGDSSPPTPLIKVVRRSPYAGLAPPPGSYVLFDGQNTAAWKRAKVKDGNLQVGTELIPKFRSFQMHIEFLVPFMPRARGQGRGNSGVYLQSRYEVQVLDSFGLDLAFNECGALYRQRAPDLNMAFPPLSWQTYDITFHSPRFDSCGRKYADARLTLLHNGMAVHRDVAVKTKTGAGAPEGPELLPIKLQDHGNPVLYRNIWLVELR
jgi:hypothetical protein